MPRTPSSRILKNRVNIWPGLKGPDGEGGPQYVYATAPQVQDVPCSVQYKGSEEVLAIADGQERITVRNVYHIMFGQPQNFSPRSKVVQTDITPNRTLYVQAAPPSEAGRGQAFVMRAIEIL